MKRLLALLLIAVMLMSCMPAFALKRLVDGSAVMIKTDIQDYTGKTIILHSNDVHGAIDGYAYMTGVANMLRKKGAEVILTDSGDFSQGGIYVSVNKGEDAIAMMNAAGYDVATLGNHEFDYGYEKMMENIGKAEFPVICANVYKDGELILPASTVIETQGSLKLGFFGMETPETATKVNPALIEGIRFSTFDDLLATAQKAIDELKAQDVDLVIGLWHLGIDDESTQNGYRSIDVYSKIDGVDIILDGHSHTVMTNGPVGEPIQSTGTKFATVGVVVIDNATKSIVDHYLLPTEYLTKDEAVDAKAQEIITAIDEIWATPIGTTEAVLDGERATNRASETNMGDLITDAMIWGVLKEGGLEQAEPNAVVGLMNGGGIRATIQPGDVTMKDIHDVLPFGNTLAVVYVTGQQLLEALEASTFCTPDTVGGFPQTSGIEWTLDTSKAYDQGELYINHDGSETSYYGPASINRVSIQSINGEPFDPEATYAVISNDFVVVGGDTYNAFAQTWYAGNGFNTGIPLDDVVSAYIQDVLNGNITAETYGQPQGRMTILPEA